MKRWLLLLATFLLLIASSCKYASSSVVTEEDAPTEISSPPEQSSTSVYSPSPTVEDNPSVQAVVTPSDNTNEHELYITILTGTYMEESSTLDRTYQLTTWSDSYFNWPLEKTPFMCDGIIMGALDAFSSAFNYEIDIIDDVTFSLATRNNYELIFEKNSNEVILNGSIMYLNFPTIYKDSNLFIPLTCVSDLLGLNTCQLYDEESKSLHLWLSECSVLSEKEFIPNDNYEFQTKGEWYLDGNTGIYYNKYQLKDTASTYSGVKIGDSRKEVIDIFGAPEYQESYIVDNNYFIGESRISYTLNPHSMNDFSTSLDIFFENDVVIDVCLTITIWDND